MTVTVRYANRTDLARVNEIRKFVNAVHVQGRPDIFRDGYCQELQDHIYTMLEEDRSDVIVAEIDGTIAGFVSVEYISRPESPYNLARSFYHIEEIGVAPEYQRRGIATALIDFCRAEAAAKGFPKIELDMWEFNEGALRFYETAGFSTFRRLMELKID